MKVSERLKGFIILCPQSKLAKMVNMRCTNLSHIQAHTGSRHTMKLPKVRIALSCFGL